MDYPTLEQVETADGGALLQWWRFLPFATSDGQLAVVRRVCERLGSMVKPSECPCGQEMDAAGCPNGH